MKRWLISLPITLLAAMAIISPCHAISDNEPGNDFGVIEAAVIEAPSSQLISFAFADNTTLPAGLKLTAESPLVTPAEVNKGDPVTIKVKVTNESPNNIDYALILKVNDRNAGTQQVSLNAAESKVVNFLHVAQDAGVNSIKIGTVTGSFTVKGGSFFDLLPIYVWIFLGIVLGVVVMLVVLMLTRPAKKKGGGQIDTLGLQGKQQGKAIKPGMKGKAPMPGPGKMPQPGVPGMYGAQEGMPPMMGTPGAGQPFPQYDMMGQGAPGMQTPSFPGQYQPGMPAPAQQGMQQPGMQPQMPQGMHQPGMPPPMPQGMQQPGMPPPIPQGMQQPGMRPPQFPAAPHVQPGGMQSPPHTSQIPGTPTGIGHPQPPGMQPGMQHSPMTPQGQPGMPYGMQAPGQQPPPHTMQAPMGPGMHAPTQPGMPPPMQAPVAPGMHVPPQPGMQPHPPAGFQPMGMPRFSVSNLTITPNRVKVGEPVNVSIIVSNNGAQTGKYSVVLRIGGVVENISDMTLPPGASQAASFTVIKDVGGDYYSDIDGMGGFFTVMPLAPPAFTTSNFSVNPERVRQGQPVTISASVTNMGELAGTHTLILRIKGMAESQQEITLPPGKTQEVDFQIIKDTPGFYPVTLENWTGKFVVEMDWTG